MDFYEKTLQKKEIFKGKIVQLSVHDVLLPNGKTSFREVVNHPGAVGIIAVTEEGKLVLVKQFRKPLEKTIAEIPAGKLEVGEDPLACAKRELEEETGYVASNWEKVISFYTSPGFADEIIHIFFAEGLTKGTENTDEDEFVEQIEVTLDEAKDLMKKAIIHDAKTVFAVQYLQLMNKE